MELTEHVEVGGQNTAQVLRLLVENEILRLNVWNNPVNDPKRGVDNVGTVEKSMTDVSTVVLTLSGSVANPPTDNMGNVRQTNLATESWDCHLLDRTILCACVGAGGHQPRTIQSACMYRYLGGLGFLGWG